MVTKITKPTFQTDRGKIFAKEAYAKHIEAWDNLVNNLKNQGFEEPHNILNYISEHKEEIKNYIQYIEDMIKETFSE